MVTVQDMDTKWLFVIDDPRVIGNIIVGDDFNVRDNDVHIKLTTTDESLIGDIGIIIMDDLNRKKAINVRFGSEPESVNISETLYMIRTEFKRFVINGSYYRCINEEFKPGSSIDIRNNVYIPITIEKETVDCL